MRSILNILWVDDEPKVIESSKNRFIKNGFNITGTDSAKNALKLIMKNRYDLLLIDLNLGSSMNGLQLISRIRLKDKITPIFVLSAYLKDPL